MAALAHALPARGVSNAVSTTLVRLLRDGRVSGHVQRGGHMSVGSRVRAPRPAVPSSRETTRSWKRGLSTHHWKTRAQTGPVAHRFSMHSCMVCVGIDAGHDFNYGVRVQQHERERKDQGSILEAELHPWMSIASANASMSSSWTSRWARLHATTSARANVGAEARAHLGATINRSNQRLALEADAVAGASARVEHQTAVRVAGVGINATAGAEGWVGAGARARLHVAHEHRGVWSYDTELGAGLGLGGALHLAGTLDISNLTGHP